jgi:enoyl-CoA hydratase
MEMVTTTDRDGVWVLALSRPPVNAIDLAMVEAFHAATARAAESDACRAIVLTGEGRAFSAGVDIKLVPRYDAAVLRRMVELVNATFLKFYGLPKPTVAAVNGPAIGAGLVLALACDTRLAASGAGPLGLTEITAGIPFPAAPMAVVQHELDRHVARDLVLSGRTFHAGDGMPPGVIDATCPPDDLLTVAIARATEAAHLPAYGVVKQQLKADASARMAEIVGRGLDPMLQRWL